MIKKIKYLIFLLIFILFVSCSFDNKTGIWGGSEKAKIRAAQLEKEQKLIIDVVRVYTSDSTFSKEIPSVKSVSLNAIIACLQK